MPQPRNRRQSGTSGESDNKQEQEAQEQETRALSLAEASDPDTLKDAINDSMPDASDDEKKAEVERVSSAVAQARQYRDSRDATDSVHNQPVVFLGA